MKILVTGGVGFIGTNVCLRLLEDGHDVIAVDNLITGSRDNIRVLNQYASFGFFEHDITEPWSPQILNALEGLTEIYHLACPTGVPNLTTLGRHMLSTCAAGTTNVIELALRNQSRIVFTSSSEVYGNPLISPQDESYTGNVNPVGLRSPYEEGKRFAESLIVTAIRTSALDGSIVRVFNTYGPYMATADTRVIPSFINQALHRKPLTIRGDGRQTRTFLYVDDLVNGLRIVMDRGLRGMVYNLGSPQEYSIADLAAKILSASGWNDGTVITLDRPAHDHNHRHPSLARISALGWKQVITLDEGLQKTMAFVNTRKSPDPDQETVRLTTLNESFLGARA